ncbi:hypothetical protein J2X65_003526 [Ancylobacter sp. 3268]|uniref:hypothetical protein n=1 Tax=Ancylobacter sp. 3268 TaxID=2817752 RepID=UPI00285C0A6D|nr:hypothetical protein [Ancylobacter sp. 3268]MDR6954158.1 hypothetical protein [Ancylobacter sp. 3268]
MERAYGVKRRGDFRWMIEQRVAKAPIMRFDLRFSIATRTFDCSVWKRYSKASPWMNRKPATEAELAMAKQAIGAEEIARCVAASLATSGSIADTRRAVNSWLIGTSDGIHPRRA